MTTAAKIVMNNAKKAPTIKFKPTVLVGQDFTPAPKPVEAPAVHVRPLRVAISPNFDGVDEGDGGIRRVVEAQKKWLPSFGVTVGFDPSDCDVFAYHAVNSLPKPSWHVGQPWVCHNHGLYWDEYEWEPWCREANLQVVESIDRADLVTAPSEWLSNVVRRGFMKECTTIPHGVDIEDWPEGTPEGYVFWNKTRVDPVCDPRPLIELARLMPNQPFVSTFGQDMRAPSNVALLGKRSFLEGRQALLHASVYLCTTRETFGIGTLEAMAAGIPILGWAWGGQAEFVQHEEHGWLCAPGDFDGLAEGLEYCLRNRPRLGKAARAHVSGSFTWRKAIEQHAALYRRALDESSRVHGGGSSGALSPSRPGTPVRALQASAYSDVSVVIPCYKLERYLEAAIVSAQTHLPGAEILVVDDCSPGDGSPQTVHDVVSNFGGATYVKTPQNLYLAGALNYGISRSVGAYIVPLDADNTLDSGIQVCINALRGRRDVDIAYGAVRFFDEQLDGSTSEPFISEWPGQWSFVKQITGFNQVPSTCAYRRNVWARVGGYRPRCKTAEDADFWCRATSFGGRPARVSDAVTFTYRNRVDSMSHSEPDWPWSAWYSWSTRHKLTPMAAALTSDERRKYLRIPSLDPALISVIIPVGPGHTGLLVDALDSVVTQTFQKWELIVVNDSGEELTWLPPFVRLATTSETGGHGPARARNVGLAMARGRAFLFLDADDYLQPEGLEALWGAFNEPKEKGGGGLVYGDFYEQPTGKLHVWQGNDAGIATEWNCELVLATDYIPVTFLGPMAAVRGHSTEADGVWFDELLKAWEDWDFLFQLHAQGWCGTYVQVPVFNYRYNTGFRADKMYADKDIHESSMVDKWGAYLMGHGRIKPIPGIEGKKLMGCSGCRGGGAATVRVTNLTIEQQVEQAGLAGTGPSASIQKDFALVDYIGANMSTVTYRGPSGTPYRFGATSSSRTNYVRRDDLAHFVQELPHLFKLHESEVGVAASAPLQTPATA